VRVARMETRIRVVNDCIASKILRNSDYYKYSAIGAILDNSIKAETKQI
jgi:hypothetical protein